MKIFKKRYTGIWVSTLLFMMMFASCKKYLDTNPDKHNATVSTLEDVTAILDNNAQFSQNSAAASGETSADNYFVSDNQLNSDDAGFDNIRDIYTWGPNIPTAYDWQPGYSCIYRANLALESLAKIQRTTINGKEYDRAKGTAFFFRGYFLRGIVNVFAKAYNPATAKNDLGVPLRLNTNFNEKSTRASLEESFQKIVQDLKAAIAYLPNSAGYLERPSKPAAYGLLAKVCLEMRDYGNAGKYADSCLAIKANLLNYNGMDTTSEAPFQTHLDEVLFYANLQPGFYPIYQMSGRVDTTFFKTYALNDIRRSIYYSRQDDGYRLYKGMYSWLGYSYYHFSGIATDEIYLIRAECEARAGKINEAMKDLNDLMKNRYDNTFVPFSATTKEQALQIILDERRKELAFRDTRWSDIKRLNLEGANISITRKVNGKTYTLPPNDNRYALPIPQTVIDASGMPQNPR